MTDDAFEQAKDILLRRARKDPSAFAAYVLKDEKTGDSIEQAPMHEAWQDEITANRRVVIWSHVEAGKSFQVTVARTLFELGNNTSLRVAVVSNTFKQAEKFVGVIGKYIEKSPELHEVFPDLKPNDPWTGTNLFVARPTLSKDPSVQACGVHGAITGSRIDLLILDDMLDYENCRTEKSRKELWDWIQATLVGRLTQDAKVIFIGTAYHPGDAMHQYAKQPGVKAMRYPVYDEKGEPRWPSRWSKPRIEERRTELSPIEFARQMECKARDDIAARFQKEWIDICIKRGEGKMLAHALADVPAGCRTYTGVDLGVKQTDKSDFTTLFSILVYPDESREVLNIESGRWTGPEIVRRIVDVHRRFGCIVMVENVAAQDYILQFTREQSAVPVVPFTTGKNKADPSFGVESLAVEFSNGKWIIPSKNGVVAPEVSLWISEMLYYDPLAHTGDRLMASWFAREAARVKPQPQGEIGYINTTAR